MNTSKASAERRRAAEYMLRVASLAAAMRVICRDGQPRLSQQSSSEGGTPKAATEVEFRGRAPFVISFTEGQEARFHVPTGHSFVIEHVYVSCWAEHEIHEVQMVTQSRHMLRRMTLWCGFERSVNRSWKPGVRPIVVQGLAANLLLFSNGVAPSSLKVPADTCLQLWGYLEPTEDTVSF